METKADAMCYSCVLYRLIHNIFLAMKKIASSMLVLSFRGETQGNSCCQGKQYNCYSKNSL